jgi:hypothetical protein
MSGELIREDDLDDAAYQRREVFAHYGAAMFYAQVLEQGLVNVLTFAQTATSRVGTREVYDFNFTANLSVTMGRLLRRLKPFFAEDLTLDSALSAALELRNRLAHSYWVEHDRNFFSFAGREIMLTELIEGQELFQEVDKRLAPVLERYLSSLGIAPEQYSVSVAEALDRMRREAEAVDD